MSGRLFAKADLSAKSYEEASVAKLASEPEANLETSLSNHQPNPHQILHKPVLDLDIPHEYRESSTPGHGHLLLNIDIPWDDFVQWLDHSVKLGIFQDGWVKASKARGFACIRKQGVMKTEEDKMNSDPYPDPKALATGVGHAFSIKNPF